MMYVVLVDMQVQEPQIVTKSSRHLSQSPASTAHLVLRQRLVAWDISTSKTGLDKNSEPLPVGIYCGLHLWTVFWPKFPTVVFLRSFASCFSK